MSGMIPSITPRSGVARILSAPRGRRAEIVPIETFGCVVIPLPVMCAWRRRESTATRRQFAASLQDVEEPCFDQEWLSTFAAWVSSRTAKGRPWGWRPWFVPLRNRPRHDMVATASHVLSAREAARCTSLTSGSAPARRLGMTSSCSSGLGWGHDEKNMLLAGLSASELPGARIKAVPPSSGGGPIWRLTSMTCLIGGLPVGLPGLDPLGRCRLY